MSSRQDLWHIGIRPLAGPEPQRHTKYSSTVCTDTLPWDELDKAELSKPSPRLSGRHSRDTAAGGLLPQIPSRRQEKTSPMSARGQRTISYLQKILIIWTAIFFSRRKVQIMAFRSFFCTVRPRSVGISQCCSAEGAKSLERYFVGRRASKRGFHVALLARWRLLQPLPPQKVPIQSYVVVLGNLLQLEASSCSVGALRMLLNQPAPVLWNEVHDYRASANSLQPKAVKRSAAKFEPSKFWGPPKDLRTKNRLPKDSDDSPRRVCWWSHG